jgi:hypothetical protein
LLTGEQKSAYTFGPTSSSMTTRICAIALTRLKRNTQARLLWQCCRRDRTPEARGFILDAVMCEHAAFGSAYPPRHPPAAWTMRCHFFHHSCDPPVVGAPARWRSVQKRLACCRTRWKKCETDGLKKPAPDNPTVWIVSARSRKTFLASQLVSETSRQPMTRRCMQVRSSPAVIGSWSAQTGSSAQRRALQG